jgi:hypothetical protein
VCRTLLPIVTATARMTSPLLTIREFRPSSPGVYVLTATQVERITSSGAVAWTITIADRRERLVLSGSNLISVTESTAPDGTVSSTLTGISTSSEAAAWTRTLTGRVLELEPFSAGTYAIVVAGATTTSGSATRSLVAIGNDGSVLWTATLT